jgi:hypothetical protein
VKEGCSAWTSGSMDLTQAVVFGEKFWFPFQAETTVSSRRSRSRRRKNKPDR